MLDESLGDDEGVARGGAVRIDGFYRGEGSTLEGEFDGVREDRPQATHRIDRSALVGEHHAHPVIGKRGGGGVIEEIVEPPGECDEWAGHRSGDATSLERPGRGDVEHGDRLVVRLLREGEGERGTAVGDRGVRRSRAHVLCAVQVTQCDVVDPGKDGCGGVADPPDAQIPLRLADDRAGVTTCDEGMGRDE